MGLRKKLIEKFSQATPFAISCTISIYAVTFRSVCFGKAGLSREEKSRIPSGTIWPFPQWSSSDSPC